MTRFGNSKRGYTITISFTKPENNTKEIIAQVYNLS